MKHLGDFELDTLQIFFPWDDDFVTYLINTGFGKSGLGWKAIPVIYTDAGTSTGKSNPFERRCVINPSAFGKTAEQLGWKATAKPSQPIIPPEKPKLRLLLDNHLIIFKAIPRVHDKNEYHMEYSSMSAFGKMYSNWVAVYTSIEDMNRLFNLIKGDINTLSEVPVINESQQAQREAIDYVEVPLISYEFSLSEFEYAKDLLRLNGYADKKIPALVYDSKDPEANAVMKPIAKVGILHTTGKEGFDMRRPQFVIKISQPVESKSKRGKRAKVKGILKESNGENIFVLDRLTLSNALLTLTKLALKRHG